MPPALPGTPQLMKKLGEAGREHMRQTFLIIRHRRDYLPLPAHLSR